MDRPDVISKFFRDSNSIDSGNHGRQAELGLEKKWVTHDAYFRLSTTFIGINVTDTWHLMTFHSLFPYHICQRYVHIFDELSTGMIPIQSFAGALAAQLIKLAQIEGEREIMGRKREYSILNGRSGDEESDITSTLSSDNSHDVDDVEVGLVYTMPCGKKIQDCTLIKKFVDYDGKVHTLAKFPVIQTGLKQKKRCRVQQCRVCKKETTMFCFECGKPFCFSENGRGHGRKCFHEHIPSRTSSRISTSL